MASQSRGDGLGGEPSKADATFPADEDLQVRLLQERRAMETREELRRIDSMGRVSSH